MDSIRIASPAAVIPDDLKPPESTGAALRLDTHGVIAISEALVENLRTVMCGSSDALTAAAVTVLSGGHLLIEDVPGVGKTVLARALAASLGTGLSRVQGHADLLPSDVTGVSIYSPESKRWEFRPGPVFSRVVLFDELNRTPPRTQSALLETMEEGQVSVDGKSWPLPKPHIVIATQNPVTQRGTFPLVESQLDRFSMATSIGYPDAADEARLALNEGGRFALDDLVPICDTDSWIQARAITESVPVRDVVAEYAVALCRATRSAPGVKLGASPRATIWLIRCARAHALVSRRTFVTPDDVKAVAVPTLAHRLVLHETDGSSQADQVIRTVLETTASPRP